MKHTTAVAVAMMTLASLTPAAQADSFETRKCINMGNALDAPQEGDWGHVIEATSFERIAEAGLDTVRIPVRWSAHTGGAPSYDIDPAFFQRVTDVVDQALSNELHVILNIHHFDALNENPAANADKFIALWAQIAERYQDLPESVYFEVINEPNKALKGEVMRSLMTRAFQKIRETNPTRILIVAGEDWSSIRSLPSIPVIDDPNQVHTFHYYDPFPFTHQKASWTPLKDSGVVRWGSAADRAELARAATVAKTAQAERGIPLFLGEIGAYEQAPYSDVVEYTYETRKAFEAAGISWCVWSFTATFPFFDTDSQQWDTQKLAALGLGDTDYVPVQQVAEVADAGSQANATLEDAFNALRRHVGHDGELMMAPFADQLGHYGPIKVKRKSDDDVPGDVAIEVKVRRAAANPWDAGISGPLAAPVTAGDTLVMAYWARTVKQQAGVISNAGLQMSGEPYSPLAPLQAATLTPQWQRFIITAVAERDYAAGEAGYTMQVAGAQQTIRIGPVFVMNLGQGVTLATD